MENNNSSSILFKKFAQSIKSNDISSFNDSMLLIKGNDLKKYFSYEIRAHAEVGDNNVSLLYYAISHQNYAMAKALLEFGAEPNEISGMLSVSNTNPNISSTSFFEKPIDKNPRLDLDNEEPPIVLAAMLKNTDLVYLLLSFGADPIIYDMTSRNQDCNFRDAQKFVIAVRDEWLKEKILSSNVENKSYKNFR